MAYKPRHGDIVTVDFNPQAGHEQKGRRPALVISNNVFNSISNSIYVCPITNTDNGFPLHVPLDVRSKTTGYILCEHMKALDLTARKAEYQEKIPDDILDAVIERICISIKRE